MENENILTNDSVLKSRKRSKKKSFILAWGVVMALLIAILAISVLQYSNYQKGQQFAVDYTTAIVDDFDSSDYDSLVHEIYRFYNPDFAYYSSMGVDTTEARLSASRADEALADILNAAGYECYRGSYYLEYTTFSEFAEEEIGLITYLLIWGVLAILLLVFTLRYSSNLKSKIIIDGNKVICKKKEKIVNEFLIKDITSVETISHRGLKLLGNGICYKITLLENIDELRNALAERRNSEQSEGQDNLDGLTKYKNLLDSGVITQEEFDAKKKQLLGL